MTLELCATLWPLKVQGTGSPVEHEGYWYEPERFPLLHVRDCEEQDWPYGTVDACHAVTEFPCVTVAPLNEQLLGFPFTHVEYRYMVFPESVPFQQLRVPAYELQD